MTSGSMKENSSIVKLLTVDSVEIPSNLVCIYENNYCFKSFLKICFVSLGLRNKLPAI